MKQAITQDRPVSAYFMQIPNMADDDLDPFQFRLYAHYIRRAGTSGACFESVRTTAQACSMSITKVIQARDWLAANGWISTEEANANGTLNVRIRDRMPENVARYAAQSDPNMEQLPKSDPNMDRLNHQSDPNMEQLAGASDPNMEQTDPNMDQSDPNMESKNNHIRITNKNTPDPEDRQTDRVAQPAAGVCLSVSDTEKAHAAARKEIIHAFQQAGVLLPSGADAQIDEWIRLYPMPAIVWAIGEARARRDAGKRISRWSGYVSSILENKAAEGWPAEVIEDIRRGGYAVEAHDPTAGEFPAEAAQVDADQAGGWSPADVQADPGSELDQAWADALAALGDRMAPVYVAALGSCRLVGLNGRATVRAHDAMAEQAVRMWTRQLEITLGVSGVDLAPAA